MKKKVFTKIKNLICLTLVAACLAGVPFMDVAAAGKNQYSASKIEVMDAETGKLPEGYFANLSNARAVLTECQIIIDFASSGMGISIFTGTTDVSPVVGVKDIKVEQKVWYGWKTVAVSSGASVADTSSMSVSVTYTGAVKGQTYRVSCVHYADLTYDGVTNYTEGTNNTGAFVFTY